MLATRPRRCDRRRLPHQQLRRRERLLTRRRPRRARRGRDQRHHLLLPRFEQADRPAGESTNPKRDLPIAAIGSILLGLVIYISRQIVSPGGTGRLIYTAASSRASYGLSRNGYVPTIFEHLSKRRVPWFDVVTAFVVSNLIILWSGWDTDWKLGIAIVIGYVILIANRVFNLNPIEPRLNWRAASLPRRDWARSSTSATSVR